MKYKLRNKKTGAWVRYGLGEEGEELETVDRRVAQDLADELQDYCIDAEIVEVET